MLSYAICATSLAQKSDNIWAGVSWVSVMVVPIRLRLWMELLCVRYIYSPRSSYATASGKVTGIFNWDLRVVIEKFKPLSFSAAVNDE